MAVTIADTDVLIDFLRGSGAAARVETVLATGRLGTTAVAAFELRQGVDGPAAERAVDALLGALLVLPLTADAARRAGQVRRRLRRAGADIGVADGLVAGICLAHAATLMTRNRAHFERVEGLALAPG